MPNLGYAADQDVARIDRLRCLLRELLRVGVQRAAPVAADRNMLVQFDSPLRPGHVPSSSIQLAAWGAHKHDMDGWSVSHLSAFHQVEYPDLSISLCATGARQVSCAGSSWKPMAHHPSSKFESFTFTGRILSLSLATQEKKTSKPVISARRLVSRGGLASPPHSRCR